MSFQTIPHLIAVLDVLDHAVSFSCSSQHSKFGVFDYLDRRRAFIRKITIMSNSAFTVDVKKPNSDGFLSPRLRDHKTSIISLNVKGVALGHHASFRRLRNQKDFSGDELWDSCLTQQRKLCAEILKHLHRLPETDLFLQIENCIRPSKLLGIAYNTELYAEDLKKICTRFCTVRLYPISC